MSSWQELAAVAVTKFCRRTFGHVSREDREDYAQIALLAAWRADGRYDDARGMTYKNYVITSCYRALVDALRSRAYGDWFVSRVEAQRGNYHGAPVSLNGSVNEELEEWQDLLADNRAEEPFEQVIHELALEQILWELPERERNVIILHDLDGYPLARIAAALGLSESRISQIRTSGLRRLGRPAARLARPAAA